MSSDPIIIGNIHYIKIYIIFEFHISVVTGVKKHFAVLDKITWILIFYSMISIVNVSAMDKQ